MLVTRVIQITIFITIILLLENLNFTNTFRYRLFMLLSMAFNTFMGYASSIVFVMIKLCFTGSVSESMISTYLLPRVSISTNYAIGLVFMIAYLFCLSLMNIYICQINKFNKKIYFQINSIALFAGVIIYLITGM